MGVRGIFLDKQDLRDEPRQGAARMGQDSRAAHGIFGKLQVGTDPSCGKSFPNPALGAREGLEMGAAALGWRELPRAPPCFHPDVFGVNPGAFGSLPTHPEEPGPSQSPLGWDLWDLGSLGAASSGINTGWGGYEGSPGPTELSEKRERDPKNPAAPRDGPQIPWERGTALECSRPLRGPKKEEKAPNPTQS